MEISIIIPTLNEADCIGALVDGLARQGVALEIIVVDGGSRDGTPEIAARAGAVVAKAGPGRGQQLAHGASLAKGDVLLFLHADTILADGGLAALRHALANPGIVGGNFRVVFDGDRRFYRWLTRFYAWFRRLGVYYGDSAIFVRRSVYAEIGGIRPIALMEDVDFRRRLERAVRTTCIGEPAVTTSSRRFEGRNALAIVGGWIWIHTLHLARLPPDRLARIYRSAEHGRPPYTDSPAAR